MEIHPKITPIYQTSVFKFDDLNELEQYFGEPGSRYMYSRNGNPNSDELAAAVNRLEGGAGAIATGSGMAAIFAALLAFCQAGDHVLCAADIYGGSSSLLNAELSRMGITVTYVPFEKLYDVGQYVQPTTRVMLAETLSNPLLRVADLRRLATECHEHKLKLVVDNTFASPILTQPIGLGADITLHSVTKYISGHSDVTAGVVVAADAEVAARLKQIGVVYGLTLSPMESWLAVRGLKTLRLRMREHSHNALAIAQFLQQHPAVRAVYYPGLADHLQHALAQEQGGGLFGGMMSIKLADDPEVVNRFMQRCQRWPFAPSLAGVDSSLSYPLGTSHRYLTPEQQEELGISVGVIRLSIGIEPVEELIADLKQALES
ncbi:aminotransferase class I/II-fold pyridoxal phosphate-dependent enzyme [Hymenobacter taeanensis]|uniref:Aminotransferase class I/II-fold pyridoxal phosphate-dependent enzyme n=1 Tax=Hymenobacter taeanensis TaxID=2735321 RepID=A0A6M6BHL4_9BACT|nr:MULTISPECIES: aminotransferase class I/II-fold pyridoxal phosphate-dependent enzyme [Hymenobacter]QJX47482.1 aminotransferase class I/II-fold pyridoxal phosphate-dependent enzyme [Hymenobacter taeanensis]UOQ83034.1 aminotransferase class I/II-fold pyridoxal phosphate-dependent enzyme [Hymenobacter sp. 5414T-23]